MARAGSASSGGALGFPQLQQGSEQSAPGLLGGANEVSFDPAGGIGVAAAGRPGAAQQGGPLQQHKEQNTARRSTPDLAPAGPVDGSQQPLLSQQQPPAESHNSQGQGTGVPHHQGAATAASPAVSASGSMGNVPQGRGPPVNLIPPPSPLNGATPPASPELFPPPSPPDLPAVSASGGVMVGDLAEVRAQHGVASLRAMECLLDNRLQYQKSTSCLSHHPDQTSSHVTPPSNWA
jgi:hypothetical protein